jgi:putative membrane protein
MLTTASTAKAVPFRYNRLLHVLALVFLAAFTASAIRPVMPEDWWLENGLVFLAVGLLIGLYRWLPLSQLSYILICVFLCMHEWGAHHRYAHVPIGEWAKAVFHTNRNDYDRVVHFAFGLLLAYPQREILIRKAGVRNGWSFGLPVVLMLGYGAAYEIIEALAAWYLSPDAGDAFLGLQGDPWDTHKDMCVALIGAAIAMIVTALASRWRARRTLAAISRATAARDRALTRR